MKKIALPIIIFSIVLMFNCDTESVDEPIEENFKTVNQLNMSGLIKICHYDSDNDDWLLINVNPKSLEIHQSHGDVRLDDFDMDGFVPYNECNYGEVGDCDDTNPDIFPGSGEICGNEIDDDCDGLIDMDDDECNCSNDGLLTVTFEDGTKIYVHPEDQKISNQPNSANGTLMTWGHILTYDELQYVKFHPSYMPGGDGGLDVPNPSAGYLIYDNDGKSNTENYNEIYRVWETYGPYDNWYELNGISEEYAIKACSELVYNNCDDWYLPSSGELLEIYRQLGYSGENNFILSENGIPSYYWSSSSSLTSGYALEFDGSENPENFRVNTFEQTYARCRCVRRDSPNPPDLGSSLDDL